MTSKERKKSTVKQLQVLTGFLNFLSRSIFPGRAFTKRIYAKFAFASRKLKHYHHVRLDKEFKFDLEVWRLFLTHHNSVIVCRPMVDLNKISSARQLCFYSDASTCEVLGFGAIFNKKWIFGQWEPNFIRENKPSIEYLELFALTAAVLTWGKEPALCNARIVVFCDNVAVVQMLNESTSSCTNCMYLIRLLVLNGLVNNRKVFAQHVRSKDNGLSDSLSRLQFQRFRRLGPHMNVNPCKVSELVWPLLKIWRK